MLQRQVLRARHIRCIIIQACLVALGVVVCVNSAFAQIPIVKEFEQDGEKLVAMSPFQLTTTSDTKFSSKSKPKFKIEHFNHLTRISAVESSSSPIHSDWYQSGSRDVWVVYSSKRLHFKEFKGTLKLIFNSQKNLKTFVAENPDLRLKAYPGLAYALVKVPPTTHPIEFAEQVKANSSVSKVELQFKEPRSLPL